jgi:hypothetical protein
MPLILGTNSIKDTGYDVANSLRFDDGSADNLTRTNSSTGSTSKSTISLWVKRSGISTYQAMWESFNNNENYFRFRFRDDGRLDIQSDISNATVLLKRTTRKFRDVSAWYHILVALDLTQSNANKVKLYINGTQETEFDTSTDLTSSSQQFVGGGGGYDFTIGKHPSNDVYFDGYMAEYVFIDGQALDPTSFGEFDSDSPTIWKPKDVSGLTFGTNGFHLDFENASNLGADVSGNGNNFTVNNLTSIDQTTDTCTNNFATMNPLAIYPTSTFTFSQGNLEFATSSSTRGYWVSTIAVSSGKWYWEYKATNNQARTDVGIAGAPAKGNNDPESSGTHDNVTVYLTINGTVSINSGGSVNNFYNQATSSNNIIIGCALDLDSSPNTIAFSIDGEWVTGSGTKSTDFSSATKINSFTNVSSTVNGVYHFIAGDDGGDQDIGGQANFGNPPYSISSGNSDGNGYGNFEYSVPSGYYALNTKNLSEFG